MSGPQPPRRRRIAGENKPGAAPATPQARKAAPARPVVPTPRPAPSRREREDKKGAARASEAVVPPTVRRPARPARPASTTTETSTSAGSREDAASETSSGARGRRRPTLRATLPVLVLVLGLVAAGAGYLQMQREAPLSQSEAQDAADAAATAVEKVLSFDYRDLDAYEAQVEGLLTDAYVSDELEPSVTALREQAPTAQVQVQTTVQASAAETCQGECQAGEVSVLVVIDKVTLTSNLEAPTVTPQRLRVEMLEQDGRWLVDSISYIGA